MPVLTGIFAMDKSIANVRKLLDMLIGEHLREGLFDNPDGAV